MSANVPVVSDKLVDPTHMWLKEIMADFGPDRQVAWKVLSVVLHKLRDRLPLGLAAHLGSQLPLLIRGVYYDQFEPSKLPTDCNSREEFVAEVAAWLTDIRPVDPDEAVRIVFATLSRHVSAGQMAKVREALPKSLRQSWESAEGAMFGGDGHGRLEREDLIETR